MNAEGGDRQPGPALGGAASVTNMTDSLFVKIAEIKRDHPEIAHRVDAIELEIRQSMEGIRDEVSGLEEKRSRDLLTVYIINDIHRALEEILTVS